LLKQTFAGQPTQRGLQRPVDVSGVSDANGH
jgi:hypothetical protein